MKPVIGILVALVAGLAGAGIGNVIFLGNSSADEAKNSLRSLEEQLEQQSKTEKELRATIQALSARVADMDGIRGAMRSMPEPAPAPPMDRTPIDFPTREAAASRQAIPNFGPGDEPTTQFRSMVQRVLADKQAEDQAAQKREAEQRRIARVSRQVDRVAAEIQLNDYQKEQVRGILLEAEQTRSTLMEKFRDPDAIEDPEIVGQAWRDLRDSQTEKLKVAMTPDQFEKYQQSNRGRFNLGGAGGGFGGGGAVGITRPQQQGGQTNESERRPQRNRPNNNNGGNGGGN